MSNAVAQFLTNLKAGLRASFFLRPVPSESQANWSHLMLVILLTLLIQLGSDLLKVGAAGEPNASGISSAGFTVAVLLFAAWIGASIAGRPERTLPFALVFAAIHLACGTLLLIALEIPAFRRWYLGYVAYAAAIGWIALACGVAAARMGAARPLRKGWACIAVLLAIGIPLTFIYISPVLWDKPYDEVGAQESDKREHALVQEDVFYAQPKLLDTALRAIVPASGKDIQLFAVMAASFSEQDVFMKEVKYVNALLEKRFNTGGHSIMLINNVATLASAPIASATSLGLSLKRVGEVMDKERDILFLYLSSHGSDDHLLAVEFGAMQFNEVNPKRLRQLLDEAGIKRRIVVISACYSGGFIDALKDDNSLIITAAAANRKSFGCSNEADFTYFGKAYFEQALSRTNSFIEAFDLAMPLIAAREKQDAYQPSEPRMFVGDGIKPVLAQLVQQRNAATSK
jgi:hypothetical protein